MLSVLDLGLAGPLGLCLAMSRAFIGLQQA